MSTTTKYTTKKAAELAARLAEKEAEHQRAIATLQAEQEAHETRLADALRKSGPARVALVEDLLEKFDITPVAHEKRRHKRTGEVITGKDGRPVMVDPDPDEMQRMALLADAIESAIATTATRSSDSTSTVDDEPDGDTGEQAPSNVFDHARAS